MVYTLCVATGYHPQEAAVKLRQPLVGSAVTLFDESQSLPIIDTHEHVPRSEQDYVNSTIRFGDLFNPYVSNDLASAGMPFPRDAWAAFHCIDDDWDAFAPYWEAVKHGSYARPLRIALQTFYGADDLTQANYRELVERINANNTPGIYRRIFVEACGIERAIRCAGDLPNPDDPLLVGNVSAPDRRLDTRELLEAMAAAVGAGVPAQLDELAHIARRWMALQVGRGAIEFKSFAMRVETPDPALAQDALAALASGAVPASRAAEHLRSWTREVTASMCAELGVPLALHTGVWTDYRAVEVTDLIGFIMRNPDTRMDIYHLGIPHVRDAMQIVKNFPNAYMNLCWAHIVAPDMLVQSLKEAIDMVPLNKVFAFGADYVLFIEKVYGHLWMARENVAIALGDRVDRQLMGLDEARAIQRAWFYDNPKAFYRL